MGAAQALGVGMNAATRTSNVQPLPRELEEFLRRTSARRRRLRALAACGVAASITMIWAAAWCVLDRIVPLPREVRLAVLLINGGVALLLIAPPLISVFARRLD